MLREIALLIALAISVPLPSQGAELPPLSGRVVDAGGMIEDAAEASLTQKLAAFEEKSSDQIVVATIPSLGGEAIEPYANRLFRAWGLGQAGEDNGILLLVARDDRKMRIEVGYGLEGTLTDLHSKLIIEDSMVPAFRAGDFSGGISSAVDDIVTVLEGNGAELQARRDRNQPRTEGFGSGGGLFVLIWCVLFFGIFALVFLPRIFGERVGPGHYRWMGMDFRDSNRHSDSGWSSGSTSWGSGSSWSSGSSGSSWSSGGGGFSGGGGSSGGGGASGSW